ncbi:MAG: M28 family peptidase [Caldilineaceae bacterium]|nr:M28 family peptidase [Caldilineaceae bacterium]
MARFARIQNLWRQRSLLPLLLVFSILLSTAAVALTSRPGLGQTDTPLDVPFGPVLFLISTADGEPPAELPPTAVLHARLDDGAAVHFVASGAAVDVETLAGAGYAVQTLDGDTAGAVYYLADAQTPDAAALASQTGEVLYNDGRILLVATTPEGELALLETLPAQGVSVSLLTALPLVLPTDEAAPQVAVAAPAAPDPNVAALLNRLTEQDLLDLVNKLSGQTTAVVGGTPVTIKSRYTFSSHLRNAEQFVYEYYRALGIDVTYFNWTYGSYSGRNVVAEVRGTVHPEQVLIVGGHLDSISQVPYTSAPGADDNATGTAATLLIARLLKPYRPAITVRFVHFTGEEQGQWGSKVYARTLRQRGEQVLGFIDLDMIGWDGNGDRVVEIHTGRGPKSNALGDSFLERNGRYSLGLNFERKTSTASRFSDHSPFWDNDIASFLIIENFFVDAIANDRNPYYHNTGDLPSRVDFNYVARIGRLALAVMAELAGYNLGAPPDSTPTPTPTATPSPTPTPTPTSPPGDCIDLVVNGGFELSSSWQFGSTPFAAGYTSDYIYAGARSLRMGIPPESANRRAHSSAFQRITVPSNAPAPLMLRFQERSGGQGDGYDYREVLLLNSNYSYLAKVTRSYGPGNDQWTPRAFDLTAYRGRTLVLYFNVYNNGTGSQMWNYVDQVTLGDCVAASTPPAEETPSPTPTDETPTATPSPEPTDGTPTATPSPEPTEETPTATPSPEPTETATPAPLVKLDPPRVYLGELFGTGQVTVSLSVDGPYGGLRWQATNSVAWLQVEAESGDLPGTLKVQLLPNDLADGLYVAELQIDANTTPPEQHTLEVVYARGAVSQYYLPVVWGAAE